MNLFSFKDWKGKSKCKSNSMSKCENNRGSFDSLRSAAVAQDDSQFWLGEDKSKNKNKYKSKSKNNRWFFDSLRSLRMTVSVGWEGQKQMQGQMQEQQQVQEQPRVLRLPRSAQSLLMNRILMRGWGQVGSLSPLLDCGAVSRAVGLVFGLL